MAKNVIFETQPIQFDTYVAEMGGNVYQVSPAPFTLAVGENYVIVWDGDEYPSTAVPYDDFAPGAVVIGLGEAPVTIGYLASTDYIGFISSESGEHSVGLYHVVEEESETPSEETPEEPEGIVLKDRNGKDVAYYGIETVTFDTTTEGKQQVYTKGTAVENLEIVPDFRDGDMPVVAAENTLVKSATIKMPADLAPENIRSGKEIGGVSGNFIGDTEAVEVPLSMAEGNQVISPSEVGKVLSAVTVQKPETLIPENIAEGVDIAGIIGTLAAGGATPAGAYWETESMGSVSKNNQTWFDCNGERYAFALTTTGNGNNGTIYKYVDGAWTSVTSASISAYVSGENIFAIALSSGKTYIFRSENSGQYWYVFDGTSFKSGSHTLPGKIVSACIHNGLLTAFFMSDGSLYTYSESTGWSLLAKISTTTYDYFYIASVNGELYAIKSNTVYKVDNGGLMEVGTTYRFSKILGVEGDCIIYLAQTGYTIPDMIRSYDVVENVDSLVGYGMGVQYGYMPASNFADGLPRCLVLKDGKGTYNVYSHKLRIVN